MALGSPPGPFLGSSDGSGVFALDVDSMVLFSIFFAGGAAGYGLRAEISAHRRARVREYQRTGEF